MKSNDVTNELQDGFEPAPLPPIAPDGGLELPPLLPALPLYPRLCAAGPCRHYHTFRTQTEAQEPMGSALLPAVGEQHGRVIGAAPEEFRTQDHHYCYPEVGIETKLGALPVIECSKWEPVLGIEVRELEQRRDQYHRSADGRARADSIAAWARVRDEQDAAAREHDAEAQRLVAAMVERAEAEAEAAALSREADKIKTELNKGDA